MPKTFSAWIIPGVIVPPFTLTKTAHEAMPIVLKHICLLYDIDMRRVKVSTNPGKKRPPGATAAKSYIRHMFFYFMRDVYKKDATLKELAQFMGITNHGSVIKGIQAYHDYIYLDAAVPPSLGKSMVRSDYYHFNEQVKQWL